MLSKNITLFWDWFIKLHITDFLLIEIAIIFGIFFVTHFVVRIIKSRLSKLLDLRFQKISQKFLDIQYTTFLNLVVSAFILWIMGLFCIIFEWPTNLFEPLAYITIAWLIIRAITQWIDGSLLSSFVANLFWVISALIITGYITPVSETLKSYHFTIGKIDFSLHTFVLGVVIFSGLFWLSTLIILFLKRHIYGNQKLNQTQQVLIMKLARVAIYAFIFLIGFQLIGLDLTAIAVFGGAFSFGVAFGLQKVFSNLISGIILLLDKSIRPGDILAVAGTYGIVEKLEARYVSVVTRDGKKHLIPNENLISDPVENWSYSANEVRLRISVGVAYGSDLELVRKLMLESAYEGSPRILNDPEPTCLLMGFEDSSIKFELRVWINDPQNGCEQPQSDVLFKIWEKFTNNNIKVPYPQRDIHVISSEKKSLFR